MPISHALEDVRVIDFGQYLAGPLVGMFLADHGADVIRVDPPGGPRWRHPANAALQRGKRSIVLDLKEPDEVATARRLVETADVVIEGFRPGVMARLGLAPDSFATVNDQLIWCSIPGFSRDDPRAELRGWEGIVAAATGLYPPHLLAVEGAPVFSALPLASNFAAFVASHRIAAALVARQRFGRGAHIEVSLFHAAFQAISGTGELPLSKMYGASPLAHLRRLYANLKTADGRYVQLGTPTRGVQALVDRCLPGVSLLDVDDEGVGRVRAALEDLFLQKTAAEWERFAQEELGVAIAPILTTEEWLADPHALASQTVVEVVDHDLGPIRQPGFAVRLSRTEPSVQSPRRPAGADRADVLAELAERRPPQRRSEQTEPPYAPLAGVRVVDASTLLAGPTTGRVLAQYGAEVIKIEKAGVARGEADPMTDDLSFLLAHRTMNAGKRMMFLDLKREGAASVLERLFSSADVVHHNFTLGSMERLGFSPEQVRRARPDALLSTMTLHSVGGFRERYRGHEELAQAIAGIFVRAGGDEPPRPTAILLNDHGAGHLSAFGVLLAMLHRYRTGESQDVNMSLSRSATLHQLPFMLAFEGQAWSEPSGPLATGWGAGDRLYRANDGWFYLACPHPDFQSKLASVDGLGPVRDVPAGELSTWLEQCFQTNDVVKWIQALTNADIAAHRYLDIVEVMRDPVSLSLGASAVLDHPGLGRALGIAHPTVGGASDDDTLLASRRPGMDTLDILSELGFGTDEVLALLREGTIALGENPVVATSSMPGYWSRPNEILTLCSKQSLHETLEQLSPQLRGEAP